jgi:hypothetical protein
MVRRVRHVSPAVAFAVAAEADTGPGARSAPPGPDWSGPAGPRDYDVIGNPAGAASSDAGPVGAAAMRDKARLSRREGFGWRTIS